MVPGSTIEHFTILSLLGKGGMGEVFLANDENLGRKVALKFLSEEFCSDPGHVARFLREARAASSLNHPNVCTIHEINDKGDRPFIAMEFVEGETLAQMIVRCRRGLHQALNIATQAADALAAAHDIGIVHRDVKPANMIVTPGGRVKLLDFGLAKQISGGISDLKDISVTRDGMIVGTASYMSPEQARGFPIDGRTDVWSLGICIFEMLTGVQPFVGETAADTLALILTSEPPLVASLVPGVPASLQSVISKCLRKRADDRFPSCKELFTELKGLETRFDSIAENTPVLYERIHKEEKTLVFEQATTEVAADRITGKDIKDRTFHPNNLPERHDVMVGRDNEIRMIASLLRDTKTRLVTLTGIGGTGKTRLAEAAATELLPDMADGVFLIELGNVTKSDLIVPAIADTLGIEDRGGSSVSDLVFEYLREKRLLLVLDNFEQLEAGSGVVLDLLEKNSGLKILVTSRVTLNLSIEREVIVPPLELPSSDVHEALKNVAVLLFTDRAKKVRPNFTLTEQNAPVIAEICSRLEGLPLAIELAAARMRVLSPQAILKKLGDRLSLLGGGHDDRPERHRTMRGMVKWSYDLLSEPEQEMFRRLSVFRGGFRLEAAEDVCKVTSSAELEPYELIASLTEKSLVTRRELPGGDLRLQMLDVVREYANEMLSQSGEENETQHRHAEYFAAIAEEAERHIQTADSAKWLDRLDEDHDNLRSAMRWTLANEPLLAVRMAVALRNFWILHGHLNEGFDWLMAASSAGEPPAGARFKLMNGLGLAARFRGDHQAARAAYVAGLAAGEEAGDAQGIAISCRGLGLVLMQSGDAEGAEQHFLRGMDISKSLGDDLGVAMSLSFLGDLYRAAGDYEKASPLMKESVQLFRKIGRRAALGDALNNFATACVELNDPELALNCFAEAFEIAVDLKNKITTSLSLDGFARIALLKDDPLQAARLAAAAESMRESVGYKIEPAERLFRESYLGQLSERLSNEEFLVETEAGKAMDMQTIMDEIAAISKSMSA
ncbi:MAG: protein kinase [Acidobacteria bacterium]|nr:protein kinase [Acidobacteriota bacterium]